MQVDIKILIYVIVICSRSILAFNYLRGLLPLNFQKWLICIKLPYWQYPYIIPQTGNENAQTYPVKVVTWFKFFWLIYKEMCDSQRGEFKTRSWELKGFTCSCREWEYFIVMIWISNLFEAYCKTLIFFKVLDAVLLLCI